MRGVARLVVVAMLSACAPSTRAPEVANVAPAGPPGGTAAPASRMTPPSPPPAAIPGTASSRESELIVRTLRSVEIARQLQSNREVPGVVLDRAALIARVRQHVARELPADAIRNEGLTLQLFGFVPTDLDYEGAEYQLLQDQLAGYYEPGDGTMYMAGDLGEDEAETTLAHELVHALQDQRWDLESRSRYRRGDGDRSEAVSALAEGDATSAMFDVMIGRSAAGAGKTALDLPDKVFESQIRQGISEGPGSKAPHVMRSSLAAPYIYGTLFVHALRRQGGWAAVDGAWNDAPTTSEQILHIDKWLAHEPPLPVAAPPFATLGEGWAAVDEDSEGELGARLAFEEWVGDAVATEISAGWGGDRGVLLAKGDLSAFAWRLRYDPGVASEKAAATTFGAVSAALGRTLATPGGGHVTEKAFACWERPDRGPIAVAHAGSDLVFVLGPARTGAGAWASAGSCAGARKWAREIAASP
jgi:hypothetical protein